MKYTIIGGGASGLIAAYLLKKNSPNDRVIIIERNDTLGKKLRLTGNGKCNIAPKVDNVNCYNNRDLMEKLFKKVSLEEYLSIFDDIGVYTKIIKDYGYYPLSESSPNVGRIITSRLEELGVEIRCENLFDFYEEEGRIYCKTNKGGFLTDKLIIATGGKSYPKTGSDGSMLTLLEHKGYNIAPLKASLCPVKVLEKVSSISGARAHALISLYKKDELIYQERGEVMFKNDGLSGIAVMNASSFIDEPKENHYRFVINLFEEEMKLNDSKVFEYLLSFIGAPIANYILKLININPEDKMNQSYLKMISYMMKNLTFNVKDLYDIEFGQVTRGGVSLNEVNDDFSSKKNNNIYFIGEVLDISALCGGYNLRGAITTAIVMVKSLLK